jgi:DNA-binding NarL/FixJ family response regulator
LQTAGADASRFVLNSRQIRIASKLFSGCRVIENDRKEDISINALARSSDKGPLQVKPLLSDREKAIVQLVAQGYRNEEIGEKLLITELTVENRLNNIFDKLGVSDRLELTLYAAHQRLSEHELPTSR